MTFFYRVHLFCLIINNLWFLWSNFPRKSS